MGRGATLYLRGLPEDLVREVKALAARRGMTLTRLVAETFRRLVEENSSGAFPRRDPERAAGQLEEDLRWFEANRSRLVRRYRGQYVAIRGQRVIDHDPDFDALARRVFAKLGLVPVCMPKVTARERILRVPAPRVVRA